MAKVAVIGAGITGLSVAQLLKERHAVTVFEKESEPGGLIRCKRVNGSLFHICGGHVFNTKNQKVLDWFWSRFDRDRDFTKADRRSAVCLDDGSFVPYPIENHVYLLNASLQQGFISDMKAMIATPPQEATNFDEFLRNRFGKTLYDLYFQPYNAKVWRRSLTEVPLLWLAGKLPMPTVDEMLLANMNHIEEKSFVHSSFYYAKNGGSQFIADTLARGVDVVCGREVRRIVSGEGRVDLCFDDSRETFDRVVYCGNIKELPDLLGGTVVGAYADAIKDLESHGTTAAFCETDAIPYSWFYQPSRRHESHRFICTGNFSPSNNAPGKMTCTVEFTDEIGDDDIKGQLGQMPYHPQFICSHYSKYTYPIQHNGTRELIQKVKDCLATANISICGRFAEWEYFNMDAAIASAMEMCKGIM